MRITFFAAKSYGKESFNKIRYRTESVLRGLHLESLFWGCAGWLLRQFLINGILLEIVRHESYNKKSWVRTALVESTGGMTNEKT